MKKLTGILMSVVMILSAAPASASGGIAGHYYSTDIRTFLNGAEIDSINIDGQTLISAENMEYYSFSVDWYEEERLLDIHRTPYETSGPPPAVRKPAYPLGKILGNYYETDVVTRLDGKPITAYNVGGRTYIHAERMGDWGYIVDWDGTDRTLSITSPDHTGYPYSLRLSEGSRPETDASEGDGEGGFSISYEKGRLTGRGDAARFNSSLACNGTGYTISMEFYQYQGLFFSAKLLELLDSMCYLEYDEQTAGPEEKYELINEHVRIAINGSEAEQVRVRQSGGNGHTDFFFEITGIPMYQKDEIESICFSVGNTAGMEPYEMTCGDS